MELILDMGLCTPSTASLRKTPHCDVTCFDGAISQATNERALVVASPRSSAVGSGWARSGSGCNEQLIASFKKELLGVRLEDWVANAMDFLT